MFKHYRFIDYATQGYLLFVAVLILFFHNGTVPAWQWLLSAHVLCLGAVHWLIQRYERGRQGRGMSFFRHFYPVLLYTGMFRETGALNRMFFIDYIDPVVIGWEQALFGCQPSILFMEKLPYLLVSELFYIAYFSYYIMIVGVGIALLHLLHHLHLRAGCGAAIIHAGDRRLRPAGIRVEPGFLSRVSRRRAGWFVLQDHGGHL
jgi:hypothetical protein